MSHSPLWFTSPGIMGASFERIRPGTGRKYGGSHDQLLGVCTGRRMEQPEADRWPLYLRAMPPATCSGNDGTLTLQSVMTIELTLTDVCTGGGERLLEKRETKDQV